eukprot:scaffold993_cov393-Prasinococcus_capsulatus_cf.AAC.13
MAKMLLAEACPLLAASLEPGRYAAWGRSRRPPARFLGASEGPKLRLARLESAHALGGVEGSRYFDMCHATYRPGSPSVGTAAEGLRQRRLYMHSICARRGLLDSSECGRHSAAALVVNARSRRLLARSWEPRVLDDVSI